MACEISIFNLVPRFDPDNEDIVVTFEPVEVMSNTFLIYNQMFKTNYFEIGFNYHKNQS